MEVIIGSSQGHFSVTVVCIVEAKLIIMDKQIWDKYDNKI